MIVGRSAGLYFLTSSMTVLFFPLEKINVREIKGDIVVFQELLAALQCLQVLREISLWSYHALSSSLFSIMAITGIFNPTHPAPSRPTSEPESAGFTVSLLTTPAFQWKIDWR
jgi:hypothetical protein